MAATTIIHISNLHCSSCVKTINATLAKLSPPPVSVEVSIVLQSVTVRHPYALAAMVIRNELCDAGFDVAPDSLSTAETSKGEDFAKRQRRKHIDQCLLCQAEELGEDTGRGCSQHPQGNTQVISHDVTPLGPVFRVTISVGGMTCASCQNTVTRLLSEIPGATEPFVSLLNGSASVILPAKDLALTAREAIEDAGFESQIVDIEPLAQTATHERATIDTYRTVSLRIDGMYCSHCVPKVASSLKPFDGLVTVLKGLEVYTDPIVTLSYRPSPSLTIRDIISAIKSANSPPFQVSIHHPPTVEELSRAMQRREQKAYLFRLLFAFIAAIPTLTIGIVYMTLVKDDNPSRMFLMEPMWVGSVTRAEWALFFLATPVMFYSAQIFHRRSIKEILSLWRRGSPTPVLQRFYRFGSMNLLVSSAVSVAYFASVGLLGTAARTTGERSDTTTYFDSVVFLTMFLLGGRFLESYSKARTADAITALVSLRPATALLVSPRSKSEGSLSLNALTNDIEKADPVSESSSLSSSVNLVVSKVSVDLLEVGDIIRVPTGSTPPADGVVVSGETGTFDESALTGESRLITKQGGDPVFLGTINKGQTVHVAVREIGGGTMLDRIVKVVREGQSRRAPIERVADVVTSYFVPVVTLLAICTWIIWLSLGLSGVLPVDSLDNQTGGWPVWSLQFAIAVFVVACPCGIGLAAPTALLVGLGLAAKSGILARGGGEAFQEMSQLDLVVFDKTGTLTEGGSPRVTDSAFNSSARWSVETLLGITGALESATSHPLAIAIHRLCEEKGAQHQNGVDFEEKAGRGMKGVFPELHCTAIVGNETWMKEHGAILDSAFSRAIEQWKSEAKSVVLLALSGHEDSPQQSFEIVAIFAITDPLRPEAARVVSWFQQQGIATWMISGDNVVTASAVAALAGIPSVNVIAGVLPHEKAEKVQQLQREATRVQTPQGWKWIGKRQPKPRSRVVVAMVGDGINDAPALTVADVGIAIGSGSDVAISSAGFVLLSSDLRSLITLSHLSKRIINRVKFNFMWALVYNIAAVPVAAGVIYPAGHARLNPVWASLAMALSSLSVVCSSLLLKTYKSPNASQI